MKKGLLFLVFAAFLGMGQSACGMEHGEVSVFLPMSGADHYDIPSQVFYDKYGKNITSYSTSKKSYSHEGSLWLNKGNIELDNNEITSPILPPWWSRFFVTQEKVKGTFKVFGTGTNAYFVSTGKKLNPRNLIDTFPDGLDMSKAPQYTYERIDSTVRRVNVAITAAALVAAGLVGYYSGLGSYLGFIRK